MRPVGPRLPEKWRFGAALGLVSLLLSACARQPVTPQGAKIHSFYNIVLVLAIVIWAGVVGAMMWSVVRYRKRPGDDELPPQVHGNTTFEIIWTIVPTLIVLGLFGMSYTTLRSIDKVHDTSELGAVIVARGYQWAWEFDYGDGIVVRSQSETEPALMMVPVGETIRVEERTDNVLHSMFIPDFLFKRDMVPGRVNTFDFRVDTVGEFFGQCAELCGTGHAIMTFKVKAVGREAFEAWLQEQKQAAALKECEDPPAAEITIGTHPTDLKFDKPCVSVPAGQAVELTYQHDGPQPHNVAVFTEPQQQGGTLIAKTALVPGPDAPANSAVSVTVPAQEKGIYYFFCEVHPIQMNGSYTVK